MYRNRWCVTSTWISQILRIYKYPLTILFLKWFHHFNSSIIFKAFHALILLIINKNITKPKPLVHLFKINLSWNICLLYIVVLKKLIIVTIKQFQFWVNLSRSCEVFIWSKVIALLLSLILMYCYHELFLSFETSTFKINNIK